MTAIYYSPKKLEFRLVSFTERNYIKYEFNTNNYLDLTVKEAEECLLGIDAQLIGYL